MWTIQRTEGIVSIDGVGLEHVDGVRRYAPTGGITKCLLLLAGSVT